MISAPNCGYRRRLLDLLIRVQATRAPMLGKHAENVPAIAEMCDHMKDGRFAIASHISELAEEVLSYHRDEDYKSSSCGTT
jgi:hypothetical protein